LLTLLSGELGTLRALQDQVFAENA
jgi:hypothetical protein